MSAKPQNHTLRTNAPTSLDGPSRVFFFHPWDRYAEKCCLADVPRSADAADMRLPAALVSAQWHQGINTDKVLDFVFLLGVPLDNDPGKATKGKKGKADKKKKGAKEPEDEEMLKPDPVVWFNKMSVDTAAVGDLHHKLQILSLHSRENRISTEEVRLLLCRTFPSATLSPEWDTKPRESSHCCVAVVYCLFLQVALRFSALVRDINILLVGDDDTSSENDGAGSAVAEAFAEVSGAAGPGATSKKTLAATPENIEALVALFDHNRGMDEPNQDVCEWLRSILVPQM